jgi:hypothetical protein
MAHEMIVTTARKKAVGVPAACATACENFEK